MSKIPDRGLVIRSPWVDRILAGEKTWELRGKPTQVRGPIGLIKGGSCTVVGTAEIVDVIGPLSPADLQQACQDKNIGSDEMMSEYLNTYAWVLRDVKPLSTPVRYNHPRGAITWVRLSPKLTRLTTEDFPRSVHQAKSRIKP